MPQYYDSTRSYNLGSHTPGQAKGVALEEPTAGNLHGGVREGRELTEPRLTYTRTKLETADRAKEDLKSRRFSSTRKRDLTPNDGSETTPTSPPSLTCPASSPNISVQCSGRPSRTTASWRSWVAAGW